MGFFFKKGLQKRVFINFHNQIFILNLCSDDNASIIRIKKNLKAVLSIYFFHLFGYYDTKTIVFLTTGSSQRHAMDTILFLTL